MCKVDELVRALGLEGISKSEVSRICAELDAEMARFRDRPLEDRYPYVWLDAKAVKAREDGRVVNQAAVVAVGVRERLCPFLRCKFPRVIPARS